MKEIIAAANAATAANVIGVVAIILLNTTAALISK